jgi:hypothetical protein
MGIPFPMLAQLLSGRVYCGAQERSAPFGVLLPALARFFLLSEGSARAQAPVVQSG